MPSIRQAVESDVRQICGFDPVAQADGGRREEFVARSVAGGRCFVVVVEDRVVAYGVLEHSFYEQAFIALLYVDARHRRNNYGTMLMKHMEASSLTVKIFTSTNLSNLEMQSLLAKLGYSLSGVIHNLDEGDPELVYFKSLS